MSDTKAEGPVGDGTPGPTPEAAVWRDAANANREAVVAAYREAVDALDMLDAMDHPQTSVDIFRDTLAEFEEALTAALRAELARAGTSEPEPPQNFSGNPTEWRFTIEDLHRREASTWEQAAKMCDQYSRASRNGTRFWDIEPQTLASEFRARGAPPEPGAAAERRETAP